MASEPDKIKSQPLQISEEHCYSKLAPFRSTYEDAYPTCVLFPELFQRSKNEERCPGDEVEVDVEKLDAAPYLPYDKQKVYCVMMECARHVNLVKVPAMSSEVMMERQVYVCLLGINWSYVFYAVALTSLRGQ